MRFSLYALLGIGLICQVMAADSVPARIAVISATETADLAALLTSELSGNPDIALVERDALARIGDERKVQSMAGSDASALGKLLNADGLLILEKQGNAIHARLTAVGLGYAVFDLQIAPGMTAPPLAKSLGHRVEQFLPKLKIEATKAVPISVLNLRSDLSITSAAKIERDLTLLLESRLASVPEYVVLERRHAWDLGFEHGLITSSGVQLLEGTYVLDGILQINQGNGGEVTVQARLHAPKTKQETSLEVRGRSDDLPGLVEALVAQINKTIGSSASASAWQPQTEARQYLTEGIWAWEHGQPQASVEALDSAELLGEKAPDLRAVRIQALSQLAVPDFNPFSVEFISQQNVPTSDMFIHGNPTRHYAPVLPLPDRLAFIKRAMSDLAASSQSAGGGTVSLQFLDPRQQHEIQSNKARDFVTYAASSVLSELERQNDPGADEFRSQVREWSNFDPLNGKLSEDYANAAYFTDAWANSLEEETRYYQKILSAGGPDGPAKAIFLKARFVWGKGATFCPRFIKDPAEQRKAYLAFMQDLMQTPEGKLSALLALSGDADPSVSETSYIAFLDELGNQGTDLAKSNELFAHCHAAFLLPDAFRAKFGGHAITALHAFLTESNRVDARVLNVLWFPTTFPPGEEAKIWSEFNEYKERIKNGSPKQSESAMQFYFGVAESDFIKAFPAFAQASGRPLAVTRFWQPEIGKKDGAFFGVRDCEISGNSVAIIGGGAYFQNQKVYVVNPPNFDSEPFRLPAGIMPFGFCFTPSTFYLTGHEWSLADLHPKPDIQWHLYRYEMASQAWATQDIPFVCAQPHVLRDRLFLVISSGNGRHGAITTYDWDTQKLTLLASDRRRPAQNQFDDRTGYQVMSLFLGLHDAIGTNIDFQCYTVSETAGNWPDLIPGFTIPRAVPVGDKTLLENGKERICLLIDPAKDKPEVLFAPTGPLPPALAAYGPARWPLDYSKVSRGIGRSKGLHRDAFFSLARYQTTPAHYELLWVDASHVDSPVKIPLQFSLDPTMQAQLKLLKGAPANFDEIVNPASLNSLLQMVSTDAGICLYGGSVLWFIPYEDIEAYLKSAQK